MFYYKLGQALLQIGTTSLLQIGAAITNQGKIYYKLGQVLQIRAIITNWGITHVMYVRTPTFISVRLILDMGTLTSTLIFSL